MGQKLPRAQQVTNFAAFAMKRCQNAPAALGVPSKAWGEMWGLHASAHGTAEAQTPSQTLFTATKR